MRGVGVKKREWMREEMRGYREEVRKGERERVKKLGKKWGVGRGGRSCNILVTLLYLERKEGVSDHAEHYWIFLFIHRELSTPPPLFHHPHPTLSLTTTLTLLDECVWPASPGAPFDPLALVL